ncbi:hypothetical protein CGRA01v4_00050 [Colletotrichum graminicola]|uniref:Ankyrin repeat protein n=1 Tax=Colletotrichum graminicola (strain M1.001 / M2 / FGSC 10212) TaxID=645133 RepID=E3QZZ5_COLGM|nr:uncharacterized protein GLRG_11578 [Colletotrichum graminicola M1.001]EFQ36433.1 hypothetical protein GLRG_11578 [Colletotrichum graminicola M1.001]WDK08772.1 hypothetical protein CGRA01v4_00050 [Colletotrichum graminicola]
MSRFFRRTDDSSDEDDDDGNPATLSGPSGSTDPASTRPHPRRESSSSSLSSSASESPPPPLDSSALPAPVSLIPAIRGQRSSPRPPDPLSAPLVRYIVRSVPHLDMETEEDLHLKFTYKRYNCVCIEIWLQAIDPETGDSLVHAIVRSGRIGALGACRLYPTCGNGQAQFQGHRERHILFMHQNEEGDNGLHVAARMGGLPLVRAVLRAFKGRDMDDGRDVPDEYERHDVRDEGRMFSWEAKRILFIESRNLAGRSAAEEARHHGHAEVSGFLEHVLDCSYPSKCDDRESARQLARSIVAQGYRFTGC